MPDRIFVLDVTYEVARRRQSGTAPDRIEARSREYHEKVRAGYLQLADQDARLEVFDGAMDTERLHRALTERVAQLLEETR